jgi:hypothetical protein
MREPDLCNALGQFRLSVHGEEFLSLLKGCENRQCFAVSCYCSRQSAECRRVFSCFAPCYVGVRSKFEYLFYGLTCTTRAGLPEDWAPSQFVTAVDYRFGAFIPQGRHSTESFKQRIQMMRRGFCGEVTHRK